MSHTLSQPEEIDLVLIEMERMDCNSSPFSSDKKTTLQTSPTMPNYGYVSPYRAAHIRSMQSRTNP
ncbi:MAG TPA: hypothetical protein VFW59_11835 [Gallionella sp.]|nr:hypothetical protein [Gallionella sp.]